jgi:hypothetical protein
METNIQKSFKLSVHEIKDIVVKHLMKSGHIKGDVDMDKVVMSDITKTRTEPGGDPHDAYHIEYFDGLKFTIND